MRKIMMRAVFLAGLGASLAACTSYVRTFDANNNQIAGCVAHTEILSRHTALCKGIIYGSKVQTGD